MHWVASSEMGINKSSFGTEFWAASDRSRVVNNLTPQKYPRPIPDISSLQLAVVRFPTQYAKLKAFSVASRNGNLVEELTIYPGKGIRCMKPSAQYDFPINVSEMTARLHPCLMSDDVIL